MEKQKDEPMSPTVKKVLDEYLTALHADEEFDNEAADRLDELLRKGKVLKFDDIDTALSPPIKVDEL